MAVLIDADRAAVWAEFMRDRSAVLDALPLSKSDLRAAVDAVDQWVSDNAVAFNNAIPAAARVALTTPQKALLLRFVVSERYDKGV